MPTVPTLPGVTSRFIDTPRLRIHALFSGPDDGVPVLFIHGNASSSTFWEETMLRLPPGFRAIAPDTRGYGDTEDVVTDATRGFGDWVDDALGLLDALGVDRFHAVGHSLGGAMLWALIPAAGERIRSVTVVAPGSPYGFGGTHGLDGALVYPDSGASGGGTVNPEFARLLAAGDRSSDNPQASPRVVMNSFYWKPPFRPAREEDLLSSVLTEKVGPERYPGDFVPSPHWPGVAPGRFGPVNAAAPKHQVGVAERLVGTAYKPPILWVRGADDAIVGDLSLFELGTLGKLGFVPGWPGESVHPPQPMVGQTRAVLERYAAAGGRFDEIVMDECGHSPYIERPAAFDVVFHAHLARG
jgi:pimeloyl-ACP methyl ester carboxylesterase